MSKEIFTVVWPTFEQTLEQFERCAQACEARGDHAEAKKWRDHAKKVASWH
jgi:hypothetical protein